MNPIHTCTRICQEALPMVPTTIARLVTQWPGGWKAVDGSASIGIHPPRTTSSWSIRSVGYVSNPPYFLSSYTTANCRPYSHFGSTNHPIRNHTPKNNMRALGTWSKVRPKRIRVISMDVTGTLVSFRGTLAQHYLGSAAKEGVQLPPHAQFDVAFKQAYKDMCAQYPCFGHDILQAKDWWRLCVLRSFQLAGAHMTDSQADRLFQRIYSVFGSLQAYEKFDDALPFLRWARRNHLLCGIISNADERYGDSILPMMGLTHDELQFMCFSKDFGMEKPDVRFYYSVMKRAEEIMLANPPFANRIKNPNDDPLLPSQILHIGNHYGKDFEGARRAGLHAILLDRYNEVALAQEWKRRGAYCFTDLMDVVEFLGRSNCQLG